MRVPTGIMDGPSLCPLIRHLLRKCHLPPCGGKAGRVGSLRPVKKASPAKGEPRPGAHCAPAGGHTGPPLRRIRAVHPRRGRCPHRPAAGPARLPPSRGKLSAERLTDEGAHGDNGRSFPLPPHPSFAPQMPPSPCGGKAGRAGSSRPTKKPPPQRGSQETGAHYAPAGGHTGPPLQILTDGTLHPAPPTSGAGLPLAGKAGLSKNL